MHRRAAKPSNRIPNSPPRVFTYSDAMTAGLSAERLYRYRDEGASGATRPGPGSTGQWPHRLTTTFSNHLPYPGRHPLSHQRALARYGLIDVIPDRVDVAIPRGRRIPALRSPANVRVFAKNTFGLGRGAIRVGDR